MNVNEYSKSVPSSFAILVNFGIDGRSRTLFSSNAGDHQCGDKQIWDPFNKQCRQLYCSAHFTLVGFNCVETTSNSETNITKPPVSFLDSGAQFVNITIGLSLGKPIVNIMNWINSQNISFEEEFITEFADSFAKLWTQRIANVTYYPLKAPNSLNVNFILLESNTSVSSNTNTDAILQVLSSTISQNGLSFKLYNNIVNAFSFHTTISEYKSFCSSDSDMPIWYWNSQFSMSTQNNITYLYVNETGKMYKPGQYLGNILYVQNMDMSEESQPNKVNVSSNAVVCEQTLINENCTRILLNRSEYEWINSNETTQQNILHTKYGQNYKRYELAPNGGVFVCFEYQIEEWIQDLVEAILSTVLIVISISALTCVLITYLSFKCLRSTISGFNTINLSLCIQLMQILFLVSPYVMDCKIGAIFLHYVLLLTMSWSRYSLIIPHCLTIVSILNVYYSVIAYDMYRTFGGRKMKIRHKNRFKLKIIYWFSANICAVSVVVISIICEEFDCDLRPDYGPLEQSSSCWLRNPWATFVFFGLPLIVNVLINLVLYLRTVCQVRNDLKTSDSLRKITRIPSDSSETSQGSTITARSTSTTRTTSTTSLSNNSRPNQVLIFTRLGVLMGFTWIIALIIAIIPQKYETLLKALSYVFVICNTSQGVVLFIAFLCNTKVAKLWKNLLKR